MQATKTHPQLLVGRKLRNNFTGQDATILFSQGDLVILKYEDDGDEKASGNFTIAELYGLGWRIIQNNESQKKPATKPKKLFTDKEESILREKLGDTDAEMLIEFFNNITNK